MNRKQVGILIFPNVEVLDFCGPYEVFTVTRLNEERRREEPSPFDVLLVAEREHPIAATGDCVSSRTALSTRARRLTFSLCLEDGEHAKR